MGTRRKSRELAMQMLFQGDLGKQKPDEVERLFWDSREDVDEETKGFADDIHRVATQREDEVDALIQKHAQNWRLERMPVVDRNLLRAAIAEMLGYPKDAGSRYHQRNIGDSSPLRGARKHPLPQRRARRRRPRTPRSAPQTVAKQQIPTQRPSILEGLCVPKLHKTLGSRLLRMLCD